MLPGFTASRGNRNWRVWDGRREYLNSIPRKLRNPAQHKSLSKVIPSKGYLISYRRDGSDEIRRARDGLPDYELQHRFLIFEPEHTHWTFNVGVRLSSATADDEYLKLKREVGDEQARWTILRWTVQQIEERLREGSLDQSTEWLRLESDDIESLRQMTREKHCDYQVKESRDLFCSASSKADPGKIAVIGLKTLAWTSTHVCDQCLMPDSEFLCSHLSHPEVKLKPALETRSPERAICGKHQKNIEVPACCYPSGHECWEWIVRPREEDQPVSYASPMLVRTLDHLDSIWRLRFGKSQALIKLPSAGSMADLERSCSNREDFVGRLISLADVLGAISIADSLVDEKKTDGSLNRLEDALKRNISDELDRDSALAALPVLRATNALRRAAAHGGGTARVDRVRAEQTLKIAHYPDVSWNEEWNQLRARVVESLEAITAALRKGI